MARRGHYKNGDIRYVMSSACRDCRNEESRVKREARNGPRYADKSLVLDKLFTLYGYTNAYSALAKATGIPMSSCLTILDRDQLSHENAARIVTAYDKLAAHLPADRLERCRAYGESKFNMNIRKRKIRSLEDKAVGMRVCIECVKPKFVEEFARPGRAGSKRNRTWKSHVCKDCTLHARREKVGANHENAHVRVTPTLTATMKLLRDHYSLQQLREFGIWNSTVKGVVSGKGSFVTRKVYDRIKRAESTLVAS